MLVTIQGTTVRNNLSPNDCGYERGNRMKLISLVCVLWLIAIPTFSQSTKLPDLGYKSVPDFFVLPSGANFGEVSGIALNSKGHIFVFNRGSKPLRDCLKSKSEASQHQSRSGDEDKSGAVLLFGFVISGQSAGLGQPSEGALHDPPLWLDDKATGFEVAAFDDVEAKPSAWNSRAQSFSQSRSAVSAIRPKLTQPAVAP